MSIPDSESRYHDQEAEGPQFITEQAKEIQQISRQIAFRDRLRDFSKHGLRLLLASGIAYFAILPHYGQGAAQISIPRIIIEPMPIPMVRTVPDTDSQSAINEISSKYSSKETQLWSSQSSETSVPPTNSDSLEEGNYQVVSNELVCHPIGEDADVRFSANTDGKLVAILNPDNLYRSTGLIRQKDNDSLIEWCLIPDKGGKPNYARCAVDTSNGRVNNVLYSDEYDGELRETYLPDQS